MEYWQRRYIEEARVFPTLGPGLMTIDLPNKGLLSCVEFRIRGTQALAAGLPDMWLHDCLERVELIVNGSQVVKSMTGSQILAKNMYEKCYNPGSDLFSNTNTRTREYFLLNLGRFYHDQDYMLDLGRVNDPELRIHFNFNAVNRYGWAAVRAYVLPIEIWVIPHLLRESDVMPRGYIKTSEVFRQTAAAVQNFNMTIPRGPLYNGFYLECRRQGHGLSRRIDHIEMNIDNSRLIPWRLAERDFQAEVARQYGEFLVSEAIDPVAMAQIASPIEVGRHWESQYMNNDVIGTLGFLWGGFAMAFAHNISAFALIPGQAPTRMFHYQGVYPFNLAKIPSIEAMDDKTWVNSAELGDFWIRVEEMDIAVPEAQVPVFKLLADEVVSQ